MYSFPMMSLAFKMMCCVAGCGQKHVFKAELLVGGDVICLLKSPLKINGMKFYYTVITFLVTVLGLGHWVVMFVDALT